MSATDQAPLAPPVASTPPPPPPPPVAANAGAAPAPLAQSPTSATAPLTQPAPIVPPPPQVEVPLTATAPAEPDATATSSKPAAKKVRDGSLDVMRAIAVSRVVVWHAFGTAIISWIVATMPIMFFVAGSLLARSLDRMSLRTLYRKRLKRLLVPYWFFGGTVLIVAQLAYLSEPSAARWVAPSRLFAWLFPIVDPTVSGWEGGWASSPMWYLRAYLWLLLASPVLRWAVKKAGSLSLLPAIALAGAIEVWIHNPMALQESTGLVPGQFAWMIGEFGLYAFFLMLGFMHNDGRLDGITKWVAAEWVLIGIAGAAIWWKYFPAPTGIVNHTFIGLLASGIAWVSLFLMVKPLMNQVTNNDIGGAIVHWFTARAMTIYLWHSPCIVISYWLLDRFSPDTSRIWVLAPTAILVVVAVALAGWVEDLSAGQPVRLWPRPNDSIMWSSFGLRSVSPGRSKGPLFAGVAMGVILMTTVASALVQNSSTGTAAAAVAADGASGDDLALPPAPSGKPAIADFGDGTAASSESDLDLPPAPSGKPAIADFGDNAAETSTTAESEGDLDLPPAPSGKPAIGDFGGDDGDSGESGEASGQTPSEAATSGDLDGVIAAWLAEKDVDGARVAIVAPGGELTSSVVGDAAIDDVVKITSVTKTMTASIILGLVEEGRIDLDAPLPSIEAVPDFPYTDQFTVRQLLMHTSGLTPYQSATGYDPTRPLTPEEAVAMSGQTELDWAPGTARGYSNSGFLLLGLIAEQITGQEYDDLVADRVATVGLPTMSLDTNPVGGWIGDSAGGLQSSVVDLARWGSALYQERTVVSSQSIDQMIDVSNEFRSGLGSFPVCPCGVDDDGAVWVTSIGHNGGEASVQYSPTDGHVIAISLTESFWTPSLSEADLYELFAAVRATTSPSSG